MNHRLATLGLAFFGLTVAGCVQEPGPFDPLRAQMSQRSAARTDAPLSMPPLPTTMVSRKVKPGEINRNTPATTQAATRAGERPVGLTLKEVIQRTAANNVDVKVAGYEPAVEQTRTIENAARFDPTFFSNFQYQRTDKLTGGSNGVGSASFAPVEHSDVWTVETGIKQILEEGGQIEAKYSVSRSQFTPQRSITNPFYTNELSLQLTQPLLQNFGRDVNRARITISKNNQRISVLEFRKSLEDQLLDAEKTYWQLTQALQDVATLERLLQMTVGTSDLLHKRADLDVTRVQTSQADASVAQRRSTLVRARARVRDLSDKLKQLMNDADMPVADKTLILPASAPYIDPIKFDAGEQIETALDNRLELGQQQLRIGSAGVAVRVADNNLLPSLNLQGQISSQGLDGNEGDTFDAQNDYNHLSWTLGLQLEIPLGNRAARAIWQRALLQRQQAVDQYRSLVDQITLDVQQATREVETAWNAIVASRGSRFAAADALKAIQQREDQNEPLTYNFVQLKLDTQERLAAAEQAESQAVNDYNFAVARLEKAKGTLLKYDNIIMQEESSPFGSRSKMKIAVASEKQADKAPRAK